MEHGADVNKKWEGGCTPICLACISNCNKRYEDIVKYLIEQGADVNIMKNDTFYNPLSQACSKGDKAMIKFLVEHGGADTNISYIFKKHVQMEI